jgi:tripartite-type tricarboxylate transporter receptor subunit TctC
MSNIDMNGSDTDEPGKRRSGFVWLAGLCLLLLSGLAISYLTGFGPGVPDKPKTPELSIATSDWLPRKPIELVVMAGEGDGADRLARVLQSVVETHRLSNQPIVVVNKGGQSGGEAMLYLKNKAGDPHVLMITLNNFYTTPLRQPGLGLRLEEFTPVARLAEGSFVLWVNAESDIHTVDDYLAAVRAAGPGRWRIGGAGSGQEDSLVTALLERAYGIEQGYVPYENGGEVARSLIEGAIDATVNNPSEQMAYFRAGKSRPLAAFTANRIAVLPDVPTFRELGHDLVYFMQRSVVAAPGIPPAVQAYYQGLLHRASLTEDWRDYLRKTSLAHTFLPGRPLMTYFFDERERHRELLASMGAAF